MPRPPFLPEPNTCDFCHFLKYENDGYEKYYRCEYYNYKFDRYPDDKVCEQYHNGNHE